MFRRPYLNEMLRPKKNDWFEILSAREIQVLYLIAFEHTNSEIADKLFLSKGTIATYRNNILSKLQTKNTAGMVRRAFEVGLLILNENSDMVINKSLYDLDSTKSTISKDRLNS